MEAGGYAGEILHIDLTEGKVEKEDTNLEVAENFIGGLGTNIKIAYDLMKPGVDPLSPENIIILGAGTLVGTYAPGATRIFATTKLPINDSIGWCGGGGMHFGCMQKCAGYDHIIISGKSDKPVYLKIFHDDIEICDAATLWGKGIDESTDELYNKYGRPLGVISIGQAGENLVKYSMAMVDRASTFGRGGVAAVFGSKNLKAVIVRGSKGVTVADKKRFKKVCDGLYERIRKYPLLKDWQKLGLIVSLPYLDKDLYLEKLFKARMACIGCPIGDKDYLQLKEGKFKDFTKITASAVNLILPMLYGISDYQEYVRLTAFLDDYGMDLFEFFGALDLAKNLTEKELLGDYPDSKINYDYQNLAKWIKKVAYREGLGDLLAEGVEGIIKEYGEETRELALPTSKGMVTYINPKGPLPWQYMGTMELGQILNPRGPHAAPGGSPTYFAQRPLEKFPRLLNKIGVPDEAIEKILPQLKELKVGKLLKYAHDNFMVLAALGICARAQINRFYYADLYPELYAAATGIEKNKEELLKAGERIYNLLKIANIREGFTTRDKPPDQWFTEPRFMEYTGKGELTRENVEEMLDEYYAERGWDRNGIPTKQKLVELDLKEELESL
ncbi:MAG: aldehyde ferredoxin oxidoreductase N-terminal domain-containing protein [Candidatus Lokiarchaeia archaeon]